MKLAYKAAVSGLALFSISALAQEYPLGHPVIQKRNGNPRCLFTAITMDTEEGHHAMSHLAADKADVHLEADIHAVEDNPNGFAEADWILT